MTAPISTPTPPERIQEMLGALTDIDGAAAYLGVSERTIRRWITADLLSVRRLPSGGIRIAVADLGAL